MTETLEQPKVATPGPGVYYDVPAEEYFAWDAVNKSTLDYLADYSPMHCRYFRDHPPETTESMVVGSAFHTLVLEPDAYDKRYVVAGQCEASKRDGARCSNPGVHRINGAWYCGVKGHAPAGGAAEPCTVLTAEQDAGVRAWRDALMRVDVARSFIEDDGANEVSLVWSDPETGVLCKARVDMVRPGWMALGDLKTTQCASRLEFAKSLVAFGYERQSDWYLTGTKESGLAGKCGVEFRHFAFFGVEKSAPHGVALYRLMDEAREIGREQNARLLRHYANCLKNNHWPGYSTGFEDITLPRWRVNQILEAMQ